MSHTAQFSALVPHYYSIPLSSSSWCGQSLSLLDVVVEALELDCPRHCNEVLEMEPGLAWAKEVDLRLLNHEASDLDKV